jgi:hypothetical protein
MTITLPESLARALESLAARDGREPSEEALLAFEKGLGVLTQSSDETKEASLKRFRAPIHDSWDYFLSLPPVPEDFLADRNQGTQERDLDLS